MQFISTTFLIFLPCLFLLYYLMKKEYRYLVLLVANYVFYGWSNLAAVPTLLFATVLTYIGGWVLSKKKSKLYYGLFFGASLSVLVVYKYMNFLIDNLNGIAGNEVMTHVELLAPVGLSFFIFQSTSYLNDIYRKGMVPETNILRYAAFVSFFPTVLSGPIQRSRDLLPQLKTPHDFDFMRARNGLLLLIWGFFQKMVIAGKLSAVANAVFDNYEQYDNIYYVLAAVCYAFYIYCDFSSYSDMACGVAQILGFDIRPNFRNPYLAESIAEFWNRWHMSLNAWFVENIYIPLGGSRKGTARKYLNIFLVFLFSGLWHGASWSFIVWGVFNGVLRILGDVLSPIRRWFCQMLRINDKNILIRLCKKGFVFFMITITWVFFRMPEIDAALHIIRNMLFFHPQALLHPGRILSVIGGKWELIVLAVSLLIFILVQYGRREEGKFHKLLKRTPNIVQYLAAGLAVCICIIVACSGATTFDTQFIYFQF